MDARSEVAERYGPGDYVKAEFHDESSGESEWMWVRVEFADDSERVVFGWLDNEPIVLSTQLRVGQRVAVAYDKVMGRARASELPRQIGGPAS